MALLIPEVYFMLQLPFYSVATALSLLTVSLFIFEKIYNREGAVTIRSFKSTKFTFSGVTIMPFRMFSRS